MRVFWRALLPSAIAVCLPMFQLSATAAETVTVPEGSGTWVITISPGSSASEAVSANESPIRLASLQGVGENDAVPEPLPVITPAAKVDPADYREVYRTIPFVRSEYLANPSYRHDASMEILFGELRPTVVHRTGASPRSMPATLAVPPYVYDRYLGQLPTFRLRYPPPAIPLRW